MECTHDWTGDPIVYLGGGWTLDCELCGLDIAALDVAYWSLVRPAASREIVLACQRRLTFDDANCPACGDDQYSVLLEEPHFKTAGGHPDDSGPGGNTPQDPVAWGTQTCTECGHEWEVSG